jgi:hypothetical protein
VEVAQNKAGEPVYRSRITVLGKSYSVGRFSGEGAELKAAKRSKDAHAYVYSAVEDPIDTPAIEAAFTSILTNDQLKQTRGDILALKREIAAKESSTKPNFRNANQVSDQRFSPPITEADTRSLLESIRGLQTTKSVSRVPNFASFICHSSSGVCNSSSGGGRHDIRFTAQVVDVLTSRFPVVALPRHTARSYEVIMRLLPLPMNVKRNMNSLMDAIRGLKGDVPTHLLRNMKSKDGRMRKLELFAHLLSLFPRERYPVSTAERDTLARLLRNSLV